MTGALNIPMTLSGRYRLERELGHGAMGHVYLARDLKHGREVAVKVLAPATAQALDADRFMAEVRTAAGLNHPHILTVHDSGEAEGRLYYVMPRVEGASLRDLLARERRLPLSQAVAIARQVAEGLSYAHAHGVVHRDIKPGNILVDATGHAYIADFGLAFALSSVSSARRTAAGVALGSPLYMSPEQAAGKEEVDARSDLYSLGCVLFEMLAGAPPFRGNEVRQVLSLHLTAPPPSLRTRRADVPPALEAEVQKALAKEPAGRHVTAKAFAQALERLAPAGSDSARAGVVETVDPPAAAAGTGSGSRDHPAGGWARRLGAWGAHWLVVYLAAGWLVLMAVRTSTLPDTVGRTAAVLFGAGAIAVVLVLWGRGARAGLGGDEATRARHGEIAFLSTVSVLGLMAAGVIVAATWAVPSAGGAAGASAADRGTDQVAGFGAGDAELDPRRVAVLYFDGRGRSEEAGYLAAGLTESLIDALTGVPGLEVLSRHAVAPYRDASAPLEDIVTSLEAGTVVSGTVRQEAGELQVSIHLVEGKTGTQRWTTTFQRSSSEVLAVRDQLVDEVARALRERLGHELEVRQSRQRASSDSAWRLVRQADELLRRQSVSRLRADDLDGATRFVRRADSLYAQAARLDSTWLEPMLRRAEVAELRSRLHRPAPDRRNPRYLEQGIDLTDAILARDPLYAPALEMRGRLRFNLSESTDGAGSERLLAAAAEDLERAVELQPSLALAWWDLSRVLWRQGGLAEAAEAAERALEADAFLELPEQILFQLYNTAFARERLDEAARWCELGRERYPEAQHFVLCTLYLLASVDTLPASVDRGWDLADSLAVLATDDRRSAFRSVGKLQVAKIAVRAGLRDSARAVVRRIAEEENGITGLLTYDAAHVHVLLDERDEAVRLLRRWVEYRGASAGPALAKDWWFRPLREDPAFRELVGEPPADR